MMDKLFHILRCSAKFSPRRTMRTPASKFVKSVLNLKQFIHHLILLTVVVQPVQGWSAKPVLVDGIVAIVGSDIILKSDVKQLRTQLKTPGLAEAMYGKTFDHIPDDEDALNMLIEEKLIQEAVRAIGVQISEDEVESTITQIASKNNATTKQLIDMLKAEGMNYESYKDNIRLRLKKDRFKAQFITPYVSVSDDQVKRHLEKLHPSLSLVDATFVVLSATEAKKWKTFKTSKTRAQRITSGEHESKPTAYTGYFHDLAPAVAKPLKGQKPGYVTPVIKIGDQYVVVRLDQFRKGHVEETPQYQEQFQIAKGKLLQEAYQKYMIRWVRQQKYNVDIQLIDLKKS
jgi:parvulin-like peptidyl-prolyl isomerase